MLKSKVKATVRKHRLLAPGELIVVAVSGGPDSVCLLDVLRSVAGELSLSLHVAHLDHMFRGRESADEARFVAALAEKLGIPATIEKADVPAYCRERGLSAQAGAREVRYRFLSRLASGLKADKVATGHTATDQAETFLLRMLRGAGAGGLSGIPPKRGIFIRPLIEATREEVLEHLKANRIESVTDSSNAKPVYARNRIRIELLPLLRQYNPRIVETLAAEAGLLRDEDQAVRSYLQGLTGTVLGEEDGAVRINRDAFSSLPLAFMRRVLKQAVGLAGRDAGLLSSVRIEEALCFMADAQTGRAMQLAPGLLLEREYGRFVIRSSPGAGAGYEHPVSVPGITVIPELNREAETLVRENGRPEEAPEDAARPQNYFWQAVFDYDKIGRKKLGFRSRRPGDWFCPSGMAGKRKKLQDFFVDAKIPRRKRDNIPLLVAGDDILWVAGLRTDHRYQVSAATGKVLVVRMKEIFS